MYVHPGLLFFFSTPTRETLLCAFHGNVPRGVFGVLFFLLFFFLYRWGVVLRALSLGNPRGFVAFWRRRGDRVDCRCLGLGLSGVEWGAVFMMLFTSIG